MLPMWIFKVWIKWVSLLTHSQGFEPEQLK